MVDQKVGGRLVIKKLSDGSVGGRATGNRATDNRVDAFKCPQVKQKNKSKNFLNILFIVVLQLVL